MKENYMNSMISQRQLILKSERNKVECELAKLSGICINMERLYIEGGHRLMYL